MDASEIPDDMGLLPETFITPRLNSKGSPSWFQTPRKRLQMEWYRLKTRAKGFASTIAYCRFTKPDPKLKLRFAERRIAAKELHKALYRALAERDSITIGDITCSTLKDKLITDIAFRRNAPPQKWSLTSYRGVPVPSFLPFPFPAIIPFSSVRVVSDRCATLPMGRGTGIRQVVVRISSTQRLQNGDEVKEWQGTEYVVIQKMKLNGKEDNEWKIWGTLEESEWDEFVKKLETEEKDKEPGLMDNLRNMLPGLP